MTEKIESTIKSRTSGFPDQTEKAKSEGLATSLGGGIYLPYSEHKNILQKNTWSHNNDFMFQICTPLNPEHTNLPLDASVFVGGYHGVC